MLQYFRGWCNSSFFLRSLSWNFTNNFQWLDYWVECFSKTKNVSFLFNLTSGWCDQIERFFKVLGNKFAIKSRPKRLLTFWLNLKMFTINLKTAVEILLATFEIIWTTFQNIWATFLFQHLVTLVVQYIRFEWALKV